MFPERVYYLLYFFNLWGLCTESSQLRMGRWRHKSWTVFILFANIIGLLCLCGVLWDFLDRLYAELDLLNLTNDFIKFTGASVSHLIVISESYFKRSQQRKFWAVFGEIQSDFNRPRRAVKFRGYFAKLFQFSAAMIVIVQYQYSSRHIYGQTTHFIASKASLLTLHQIRIFHYLFIVHLLNYQLNEAEIEMKCLADSSRNGGFSHNRLRWFRMYYDLVHELSNCMNEVFGWSNVSAILYLFLLLAVDMNFWYYCFQIHIVNDLTFVGKFCCKRIFSFKMKVTDPISDMLWPFQLILLIVYVFNATTECVIRVRNRRSIRLKCDLSEFFCFSMETSCTT